jgi:hypothetical protein
MKKSILVIAAAALAMASCYKKGTCECTITTDKDVEHKIRKEKTSLRTSELEKWCEGVPKTLVKDTIKKAECKLK